MFQERITLVSPVWRMVLLTVLGWLALGLLGPVVLRLEGELPITLQSLLVLVWSICWGWKVGVAATMGYLAMGAVGLPVFANGAGGVEHFMGSTAGFLWAFPVSALAVGMLAERLTKHQFIGAAGLFLLGQAVILGLGIPFRLAVTQTEASFMTLIPSLLPPVMIKTALGTLVVVAVGRLLALRRDVP